MTTISPMRCLQSADASLCIKRIMLNFVLSRKIASALQMVSRMEACQGIASYKVEPRMCAQVYICAYSVFTTQALFLSRIVGWY